MPVIFDVEDVGKLVFQSFSTISGMPKPLIDTKSLDREKLRRSVFYNLYPKEFSYTLVRRK